MGNATVRGNMTLDFESGYTLPSGDEPLTHARILHSRNWQPIKSIVASSEADDYPASRLANTLTSEKFRFRNNLMPDTLDFNTGWTANNVDISGDGKTLDDGTATGAHYVRLARTLANTNDHIFAVEIDRQTQQSIQLEVDDGTDQFKRWFNLSDLTLGTGSGPSGTPDAEIVAQPNGNYILVLRFNPTPGTGYVEVQLGDSGMTGSHTGNDRTTRFFNAWLHPSENYVDLNGFGDLEADCFCIAGHNFGTRGATVEFLHDSNNDSTYTSIASVTPTDDSPIMLIFEPFDCRSWRVQVTDGAMPEFSVVKVGKALQMERAMYGGHAPADLQRRTTYRTNISETGEILGRTKRRSHLESAFQWQHLTAAWVRTNWTVLQRASEDGPMFVAWRPDTFEEVAFGDVTNPPTAENMGIRDLMSAGFQMRGFAYD